MIGTRIVDLAISQQATNNVNRFLETADLVIKWKTEGFVFESVVTRTQAQNEATTADLVDGVCHLGEQGGIAPAHRKHQRTELDTLGDRSQGRQE